jgi:hypothetical protein
MKRRWLLIACGALAPVLVLALLAYCPTGTAFEYTCRLRVHTGMQRAEVESTLGPGTPLAEPPSTKEGSLVEGDEFYTWERDGMVLYVGFRGGRVCDKWFWAPSL